MNAVDAAVIEREREYHNARFSEEVRTAQSKYYFAIRDCDEEYERLLMEYAAGAVVLDYGCALGDWALKVAPVAKEVHGIDISDVAIESAKQQAAELGLTNTHFAAKDAHETGFADNAFDLVFGIGIIHHLDTRRALSEIARVLKPGGRAIFREPLAGNVLIDLYRSMTPSARTVDEHPLTKADLLLAREFFARNDWEFFGLTTLSAVPFRNGPLGDPIYKMTAALDRALFHVEPLRWQAWNALMKMTK